MVATVQECTALGWVKSVVSFPAKMRDMTLGNFCWQLVC